MYVLQLETELAVFYELVPKTNLLFKSAFYKSYFA